MGAGQGHPTHTRQTNDPPGIGRHDRDLRLWPGRQAALWVSAWLTPWSARTNSPSVPVPGGFLSRHARQRPALAPPAPGANGLHRPRLAASRCSGVGQARPGGRPRPGGQPGDVAFGFREVQSFRPRDILLPVPGYDYRSLTSNSTKTERAFRRLYPVCAGPEGTAEAGRHQQTGPWSSGPCSCGAAA